MRPDRFAQLAQRLDGIARMDELRIRREHEIEELRREAALALYSVCEQFTRTLNGLLTEIQVELSPEAFALESFHDNGPNIFQMNASGRIVQLAFESTEAPISTEHYRTPYILAGAVRWFNQESLEGLGIREDMLLYCLEQRRRYWLHYDPQTHRRGPVDEEYLAERFEELL